MVRPVRRLAATLIAAGFVLGLLPQAGAPHCRSASPVQAGHHGDHHQKDTDRAQQCPHCPPVECQRHSECASGVDLGSVDLPPVSASRPSVAKYAPVRAALAVVTLQPPTPPPQAKS